MQKMPAKSNSKLCQPHGNDRSWLDYPGRNASYRRSCGPWIDVYLRGWRLNGVTLYPLALRQRIKLKTCCLSVTASVSPPIRQALPNNALERRLGALHIVNLKRRAVAIAEVKLGEIAVQMCF